MTETKKESPKSLKKQDEKPGYEGTTKKSTGYEGTEKNATGYEGTGETPPK
jgi:hypothetical protein